MRDTSSQYLPELLKGNTEGMLLSLIAALDGAHGYKLIKEIEERSRGYFQFKEGTVYPVLRKLENEGLVLSEWQSTTSGHKRRCYRITAKGRNVLKSKLEVWQGFTSAMDLILDAAKTM